MVEMRIGAVTDVGRHRQLNEDSYFVYRNENLLGGMVADGMGGHLAGEVASALATKTVKDWLVSEFDIEMDYVELSEMIRNAFVAANDMVYHNASQAEETSGMGTTATLALIYRNKLITVHVGDSRSYLIGDAISQITQDHSYVQELLNRGEITPEDAQNHPNKHYITRAIGAEPVIQVDVEIRAYHGETVLLCSDGLSNVVSDEQIFELVTAEEDLQVAAENLVALANKKGGPDNITVVTFQKEVTKA
ncbi:MAG: Stp1/IreP family PP2C-type Ser/Thr phosphatase [Ruminococcaceae bacterium]|nr:Stp1/IreP family PP2C-type Ser/Thr phosphatase [Oscillospiraceae bacterium]